MDRPVLEADSITKHYHDRTVLSNVYLNCKGGEVLGLLGKNGTGKSTLLKILFGTVSTPESNIRINGKNVRARPVGARGIVYLPQNGFLPKGATLRTIIHLYVPKSRRQVLFNDPRIRTNLRQTPATLSGGELRYFEILLLTQLDSPFILLDEPFRSIEPLYQDIVCALINEHRLHKGFIITDHIYDKVLQVADRVVLLKDGGVKDIASREQLEYLDYVPLGTFSGKAGELRNTEARSMVTFEIDQQTLTDLDVFGDGKKGLLFQVFNHVDTPGGLLMLENLFRSPTTDIHLILERNYYIGVFGETGFSITPKEMQMIEHYLHSNIPVWSDRPTDLLIGRMNYLIRHKADYYVVTTAIDFIISIIKRLDRIQEVMVRERRIFQPDSIQGRLVAFLSRKDVRNMVETPDKRGLRLSAYSRADYFLRSNDRKNLRHLLDLVFEIDAYRSVYSAAKKHGLTFPEWMDQKNSFLNIEGVFNPLIKKPVPNSLQMSHDQNLCFLTGANMSGKSTFMKSYGLCVYLAHIGFPVPAASMVTTVYNGLITSINVPDNISQGHSHFYSEVRRIKEMSLAVKNKRKIVAILDEIFRGTDVDDATTASVQVISSLSHISHSLFMVSSHLAGVGDQLAGNKSILFRYFPSSLHSPSIEHPYGLRPGISKEKVGMQIVENEKIVELLKSLEDA